MKADSVGRAETSLVAGLVVTFVIAACQTSPPRTSTGSTERPTATAAASPSPTATPVPSLPLGATARATSQYTNGQEPPAQFDITVLDFSLSKGEPGPGSRLVTPPPGAQFVLYLVRSTNVSQVRGRSPGVGIAYRGSGQPGFPCALGNRKAFSTLDQTYPGISIEGWECRVVQASANASDGELVARVETSRGVIAQWPLIK